MTCDDDVVHRLGGDQLVAGGDEVRLDDVVVDAAAAHGLVAPGRPARAVSRDHVVVARLGVERVRGPDRDGRRLVAGAVDAPVKLLTVAVRAVVTGGGDDHDPGVHQLPHGQAERVDLVGVDGRCADAQVDDADPVLLVVLLAQGLGGVDGRDDPLQRPHDVGGRADALRVEYPEVDHLRVGREAGVGAVGDVVGGGGERGDVRAVAVGVVDAVLAREVLAVGDVADAVVVLVHAGVQHRDVHVLAFEAAVAAAPAHLARAGRALYEAQESHLLVLGREFDLLERGEFFDRVGGEVNRHRVEALELAFDLHAAAAEQCAERALRLLLQPQDDRNSLSLRPKVPRAVAQRGRDPIRRRVAAPGRLFRIRVRARRPAERRARAERDRERQSGRQRRAIKTF